MKHLLRNLLDHKLAVLAIVLLLFAQAFCELSLPNYTADIVDVGSPSTEWTALILSG